MSLDKAAEMAHIDHPAQDYQEALTEGAQFIDVRSPKEVATGTLPGTTNIPLDELSERVSELDLNRRVVLLCRSGVRSTHAAEQLTMAGFTDVVSLAGGMKATQPKKSFWRSKK